MRTYVSVERRASRNSAEPSDHLQLPGVSRGSREPNATANPGVLATIPNNAEIQRTARDGEPRSSRERVGLCDTRKGVPLTARAA